MSIVSLIQTIAESIGSPAPTFIHGEKSFANLAIDSINTGVVILDEPIKSNDTLTVSGTLLENYQITLFFLDKSELDWTPTQRNTIVESQRENRRLFINDISSNENVKSISNIITTNIPFIYNSVFTGIICQFTVSVENLDSNC